MVPVLPSFMAVRPVGVTLESWWLCPQAEDAVDVPALIGAIEALRALGLTGPVVVCMFIHRWILSLRERAHSLWLHKGITNPMMEFPYPISEMLLWVLMLEAVGANFGWPSIHRDDVRAPSPTFRGGVDMDGGAPIRDARATRASLWCTPGGDSGSSGDPISSDLHGGHQRLVLEAPKESHRA
jgi:hypothetical protein